MISPITTSGSSAYSQKPMAKKASGFASALQKAMGDHVEIRAQAPQAQTEDRAQLMARVRGRIQSGYYNSEIVIEDLSDSLAKALDKTL